MLLRIPFSVTLSAFCEDSAKLLLKLSNCFRVKLSISCVSFSVLAFMRSASESSEVPLLSINPSLEAELSPALRVFDGDVILARPFDFQTDFAQGGKNILPVPDKPLFQFGCEIGVNGFLGIGAVVLAWIFAPADKPRLVQVGLIRRMQAGAGRVVRSGPTFPVVVQIAEYVEVLLPAGRAGVEVLAARQIQARNDEMQFMVASMAVTHPEDSALIWLQTGKGNGFKIIHNALFLLRRHLVVRVPGENARRELPFSKTIASYF
jgi:hypothetical protein